MGKNVLLGAPVCGVVADHEEIDDLLSRHLREEGSIVTRHHQVADEAAFAQRERLVEDRLGRTSVVPAEQQDVGMIESQPAQA